MARRTSPSVPAVGMMIDTTPPKAAARFIRHVPATAPADGDAAMPSRRAASPSAATPSAAFVTHAVAASTLSIWHTWPAVGARRSTSA